MFAGAGLKGWFGCALRDGVPGAELGDEFAAVFCGIDCECCWDNEESGGEGADG